MKAKKGHEIDRIMIIRACLGAIVQDTLMPPDQSVRLTKHISFLGYAY